MGKFKKCVLHTYINDNCTRLPDELIFFLLLLFFCGVGLEFSYLIRKSKGLVRNEKTGIVGPLRSVDMRYPEIADDLVVLLKRVGQKALKVGEELCPMNCLIFKNHTALNMLCSPCSFFVVGFPPLFNCTLRNVQGWYDYDLKQGNGRKPLPSVEVENFLSTRRDLKPCRISPEEIIMRVLFPLVNEGFKILEEGIAQRPGDIDVIYLFGYGWPRHTGKLQSCSLFILLIIHCMTSFLIISIMRLTQKTKNKTIVLILLYLLCFSIMAPTIYSQVVPCFGQKMKLDYPLYLQSLRNTGSAIQVVHTSNLVICLEHV